MRIAIALVAALLIGTGLVLQQNAAEQAPKAHFLRVSLVADLFRGRGGGAVLAAGPLGQRGRAGAAASDRELRRGSGRPVGGRAAGRSALAGDAAVTDHTAGGRAGLATLVPKAR